jgi:Plavaka transposase
LHSRIEALPDPGPRWKAKAITPESGTIKASKNNTTNLFYRDPVEAIEHLLSRPTLASKMEFAPYRMYTEEPGEEEDGEDNDEKNKEEEEEEEEDETDGDEAEQKQNGKGERIYSEMCTGDWWWQTQVL